MAGRLKAAWLEAQTARRVSLPRLAKQIADAGRVAQQWLDPSQVFIASVWDVLHAEGSTHLTLAEFKELLPLLQRRGYVTMSRLDLSGAAHKRGLHKLEQRSETSYLGATWHLFNLGVRYGR